MMRRRRWGRSWIGMSISAKGRLGQRCFDGCCMMSGLRMRRLLQRRRWTLRGMRRGTLACCGRWRRGDSFCALGAVDVGVDELVAEFALRIVLLDEGLVVGHLCVE